MGMSLGDDTSREPAHDRGAPPTDTGKMVAAGILGLIATLLLLEAVVFAIASFGVPLHWSCLLVAAVLAAGAFATFYHGRSVADEGLLPTRTANQITQDIKTVKEQWT